MNQAEANYLKSVELLGEQIRQSFNEASRLKLPAGYAQVNKIAVFGMGGSQLGAELIKELFADKLKVPLLQIKDYSLPAWADKNSLVFLLSYSGATEEVLNAASLVAKRTKNIFVISVGGKLASLAKTKGWPRYQFNPINNPSNQPRMGTGYMMGSILAVLQKSGLLKISAKEIAGMAKAAKINASLKNQAKKTALALKNKVPVIITAEHLSANAHIMANQINESAKQRCCFFQLPELNHHLLEGLKFPKDGRQNLRFIFINSKNYYFRNQKRFKITQEVLKKQKLSCYEISFNGSKIAEAMRALAFGSLLSYELSKLNKVDPNKIEWVNYFKARMSA